VRKPPPGADDIWATYAQNSGVQSVAITGPLTPTGLGDSASRRRILTCMPASKAEEDGCARKILSTLARRAFRQQVTDADVDALMSFYQTGRAKGSFDAGIEQALARVLVDPRFTSRLEKEPASVAPGRPYRVSDIELASRLSFFLWSSIPDDELLDIAIKGRLHEPAVLEAQTRRMLADPKADALVTNFGGQWLFLRELKNARPETRFSENLRQSFRRETELLLDSIVREDRNVLDLLTADYSFVNERIARHYGIPNVTGNAFRRVTLPPERRGILTQGSILVLTSVADRTSPVMRGKWVMEVMMGSPPPAPPADVPAFEATKGEVAGKVLTVRERMETHRANPTCMSCHRVIDPIGLSLENFDVTGKYRIKDAGAPVDTKSTLYDGTPIEGSAGLRAALLKHQDVVLLSFTENLMTYALGRRIEGPDMWAVRRVIRDAEKKNLKISAFVHGVATSPLFTMGRVASAVSTAAER